MYIVLISKANSKNEVSKDDIENEMQINILELIDDNISLIIEEESERELEENILCFDCLDYKMKVSHL